MSRAWLVVSLPLLALGLVSFGWGSWHSVVDGSEHAERQAKEMRACVKDLACDYKRLEKQQQYEPDPGVDGILAVVFGLFVTGLAAIWSVHNLEEAKE